MNEQNGEKSIRLEQNVKANIKNTASTHLIRSIQTILQLGNQEGNIN
ncbi:MAG: hypothetical protein IIC39_02040 [Candidatus Marinimicrobia bacterium]|nr:hypothetical protein [Candidatus Neomarinimicrobiota bacterium]MCH8306423.1 hypothetical protein [Candidatus Neomarinimicrobiota bacterium]